MEKKFKHGDRIKIIQEWNDNTSSMYDETLGNFDEYISEGTPFHNSGYRYKVVTFDGQPLIVYKIGKIKEEFVLPSKWAVKRTPGEVDEIVTEWANIKSGFHCTGNYGYPYVHSESPSGVLSNNKVREGFTEITFEQFKQYVLDKKTDFVIPEKWCVKGNSEKEAIVINSWLPEDYQGIYSRSELRSSYFHYPNFENFTGFHKGNHTDTHVRTGYKEITFEQFTKHILKQETMAKKIIGYRLKTTHKKYESTAKALAEFKLDLTEQNIRTEDHPAGMSAMYSNLEEAGVLDKWFDAVYADEPVKSGDIAVFTGAGSSIITSVWTKGRIVEVVRVEGNNVIVNGGSNHIDGFRKATAAEKKTFEDARKLTIRGYKAEKTRTGIKFGCQEFTKAEMNAYARLYSSSEINGSININGRVITEEEMTVLITLMNG